MNKMIKIFIIIFIILSLLVYGAMYIGNIGTSQYENRWDFCEEKGFDSGSKYKIIKYIPEVAITDIAYIKCCRNEEIIEITSHDIKNTTDIYCEVFRYE